MRLSGALLAVSIVSGSLPAWADPIQDPGAWTQTFKQAALKTDTEAMSRLVAAATPSGVSMPGLPEMFRSVKSVVGSQDADYAEEFDEKILGTFLKKINVAVSYHKIFVFYGIIMGRHADGWAVYSIKVDGNVNNILSMPWPGYQ